MLIEYGLYLLLKFNRMLFNSISFWCFLPIVFFLYWFVFRQHRYQNALIVIASYVFYGWWDWRFLILIAMTSMCSFVSGLIIERFEGLRKLQQVVSIANIALNLIILGFFKYFNFFVENLDMLFSSLGFHFDWVTLNIILPVGISFYSFQAISYTIDVYQKKIPATHDVIEFFAYVSFFPQLVAGPIERATNLLPQFQKNRQFDYANAVDGCRQMLWGFFKKMVIADNCAMAVNYIFVAGGGKTGFVYLVGGFLFTFQIYCDFSGYSDIAIGCARLFGFNLMRNFNFPYFSRSIPDFWRRWHISLTSWFRDYIYFPLGGSRCVKWKVIRNVYTVWIISGLWHGANWTFICWGMYHGTLLVIYNLLGKNKKYNNEVVACRGCFSWMESFQILFTFFITVIGWIIFRAETITDASNYFNIIFSSSLFDISHSYEDLKGMQFVISLPAIVFMLIIEWQHRYKQHALQFSSNFLNRHIFFRYSLYIFLIMAIMSFAGSQSEFIYFQF